ncbi:MAG: hypothetical protein K2P00_02895, partial [Alistipes sp.]|nr:hypothetical protein [Alistipes sp.]
MAILLPKKIKNEKLKITSCTRYRGSSAHRHPTVGRHSDFRIFNFQFLILEVGVLRRARERLHVADVG